MSGTPCPSCHGMFGRIERCQVCKGKGWVSPVMGDEIPVAPKPVKIPVRAPKPDSSKLQYDTLIKTATTIEQIIDIFFQAGFDRELAESFDDETTQKSIVKALGSIARGGDALRLGRLLNRLRSVRSELGESIVG